MTFVVTTGDFVGHGGGVKVGHGLQSGKQLDDMLIPFFNSSFQKNQVGSITYPPYIIPHSLMPSQQTETWVLQLAALVVEVVKFLVGVGVTGGLTVGFLVVVGWGFLVLVGLGVGFLVGVGVGFLVVGLWVGFLVVFLVVVGVGFLVVF